MMKKHTEFLKIFTLIALVSGVMHAEISLDSLLAPAAAPVTTVPVSTAAATVALSAPAPAPINLSDLAPAAASPLRAKAMAILNDQSLRSAYQQALFSIQYYFLQYGETDLKGLAGNHPVAVQVPSLSSLLASPTQAASTTPATAPTAVNLSSLIGSSTTATAPTTTPPQNNTPVSLNSLLGKD